GLYQADDWRQSALEERLGAGRRVGHPASDVGGDRSGQEIVGNVAQECGVEVGGLLVAEWGHQPRLGAAWGRGLRHHRDGTARRRPLVRLALHEYSRSLVILLCRIARPLTAVI